ncbi:MAG: sensor diguanylate cyclase [Nevskia sp.]|nr:sensor diguanylate cyclase [Nevskia sp.]
MLQQFADMASGSGFLPHGYCLAWDPLLLWTIVVAHAVIGASYFSIPIAIFYFLKRQKDLRFNGLFLMFGLFILACGSSHFTSLLNIWYPVYRFDAAVLAVTAGISLATALLLWPLIPRVSAFLREQCLMRENLQAANRRLGESLVQLEQRRLQASQIEQRFRLSFENASIGKAIVALDGRWIDVNNALCAMLGYSEQEFLDTSFQDITHPDDLERDMTQLKDLLAGRGNSYRMEKRYFHKRGHEIYSQLDVAVQRDEQGQAVHFISQIQDITARKRVEAELRDSKRQLEAGFAKLERQNEEIIALGELSTILQSCHGLDEMIAPLQRFAQLLFPGFSGALYLMHASRDSLERVAHFGEPGLGEQVFHPDACWALRRGQPHWLGQDGLCCTHVHAEAAAARAVLCIPVTAHGETIAMAFLQAEAAGVEPELQADRPHLEQLAGMLADRVGIAIANVRLRETLRLQSIRDPLSGLLNRRYLEESLPRELDLARREQHELAVLMIDIDHFKRFNDTYGHDTGDQALRLIGQLFIKEFRGSDIACRFGGEEFTIVLPRTGMAQARSRAQDLLEKIRRIEIVHGGRVVETLTASVGIACFSQRGETASELIGAADQALYQAKRGGRDRTVSGEAVAVSAKAGPGSSPASGAKNHLVDPAEA